MATNKLPLEEVSIEQIYINGSTCTYEIPIYQRNYAWGKDEITALIQDVYDAYKKDKEKTYFIGTLVSYHKGEGVFEIIDGQQRLTTIRIVLAALGLGGQISNRLTYRARKKSDATLRMLPTDEPPKKFPRMEADEKDAGIVNGYDFARNAIDEIVSGEELSDFCKYFKEKVHIIHYKVPKDIDLNHYFEIMNSRGEQLEKHEIVKAKLMQGLSNDDDRNLFNKIWESCSEMSIYVQQSFENTEVFGKNLCEFKATDFDAIKIAKETTSIYEKDKLSIEELIGKKDVTLEKEKLEDIRYKKDSFQPIIDFPNFLLVVLKLHRISEEAETFKPIEFNLDDKDLLCEFDYVNWTQSDKIKRFAHLLLKARFLLDNYIVHHSNEEDTPDSNPWKLQQWYMAEKKIGSTQQQYLKNLCNNETDEESLEDAKGDLQDRLVQLLSMFEVSFTARQRKNYLFYCLLYLIRNDISALSSYADFVEALADCYFYNVYLDKSKLNAINTPLPGSFDEVILKDNKLYVQSEACIYRTKERFVDVYGDGTVASNGIPLFVFNYLDYKLWKEYSTQLKGAKLKAESAERKEFFAKLGCSDFELNYFKLFYFSRTRRSLEHYYPQAEATGEGDRLNQAQINCLGNYAMIGSEANSSGSNWSPKTKIDHYLDSSKKISPVSVASIKFLIMMQMCKDKGKWQFEEIKEHQDRMLDILFTS